MRKTEPTKTETIARDADEAPVSRRDRFLTRLWFVLMLLPLLGGMLLNLFLTPPSEGITVTGAQIYFTLRLPFENLPAPIRDLPITESQVNSALVLLFLLFFCLFLTQGLRTRGKSARQVIAEFIVEKVEGFVSSTMGDGYSSFPPFVCAILMLSAFSSLLSLLGLYAPTSDINVVGGWAILVFFMITHYKLKAGFGSYVKGFLEPIPVLAPFNVLSEFSTPISMAFRHYGNVMSGGVIATLVYAALAALSTAVFGWLPGFLGDIPFFQIGLPAVLSIYFDLFSGCLQAFIFAMLTMLYISLAAPEKESA